MIVLSNKMTFVQLGMVLFLGWRSGKDYPTFWASSALSSAHFSRPFTNLNRVLTKYGMIKYSYIYRYRFLYRYMGVGRMRWLMQVGNKDGKCLGYKSDFERLFKYPKNISWEAFLPD